MSYSDRPKNAAQAVEWANIPRTCWYSSGSGRIEFAMTLCDARSVTHPGPCDADVAALLAVPYLAEQLAEIPDDTLRDELREYGAWTDAELANRSDNLARLVWLAGGDIADNNPEQPE